MIEAGITIKMVESKIQLIRKTCASLIGSTIQSFETAELQYEDGAWDDWPDLPIRLYFTDGQLLSVSWSKFDELWLSNDLSLPFEVDGTTIRWKANAMASLREISGRSIRSILLGRGGMTIGSQEIEIWTRLLFDLGDRWFEVVNALDENDYEMHTAMPAGEFRKCL